MHKTIPTRFDFALTTKTIFFPVDYNYRDNGFTGTKDSELQ